MSVLRHADRECFHRPRPLLTSRESLGRPVAGRSFYPRAEAGARKVLLRWGGPASIKTAAMELLDDLIPKSDPSDRP